uniref:Uncharacterized protein n=1 Tax=Timspurckia oligopyrenoides TaxID=708627 RepID=A0A7S1ET29_9RHOD|mmetsp:Transcript_5255/g.9184  ORF Transcript_5255/g.9184 Transcript_5255/m.9184 type:complete len:113 (+) Transcript_5255:892-1230(+)
MLLLPLLILLSKRTSDNQRNSRREKVVNMKNVIIFVCVVALCAFSAFVNGFTPFVSDHPNGEQMAALGCLMFGHTNCQCGGPYHQIAFDFQAAGKSLQTSCLSHFSVEIFIC